MRIVEKRNNANKKVNQHQKVAKGFSKNTKTGEIVELSVPTTKADVKSLNRTMLNTYRKLLYNIHKAIPKGNVYFISMTNRNMISYAEFNSNLDKFIKKLKYANSNLSDEELKYAFFKEANENGRYHIHGFIWYLNSTERLHLSEDIINDKWCYGTGKIDVINTSEDLIKTLMYLCNYSNKDKYNQKVVRKRKGLKYFPANAHMVSCSKNLEEVPCYEVDDDFFPDLNNVISQSTRDQKNIYYQSTFFVDND